MEYSEHFAQKEIWFEILATDSDILNKLAFIHLIEMKFDGKQIQVSSFNNGIEIIIIKLGFPNWDECSNAKAHCNRNLNTGSIVADYVGALDRADPSRRFAMRMEKLAKNNYLAS